MGETNLKIGFFGIKSWEKEEIEKQIANLDTFGVGIFSEEVGDRLEMAKDYNVISISIYAKIDKAVLGKLPKLKMLATRSTGTDHIDMGECKERGIMVANVPMYGAKSVAEYAMALLLVIAKKIVVAHQTVEEGDFTPAGITGVDVDGKTLGVVGVGKIGQNMVRLGRAFGMKVLGVEQKMDEAMAKKFHYKAVDLESCLRQADFVSVHVPYLPQTKHLINKSNIKLMKPGSILINTSRGAVVESEALVWALNRKILRGVGLDVIEAESQIEEVGVRVGGEEASRDELKEMLSYHMLRDRDDVVITPHNAFNTEEAIERIIRTTVENINKFIKLKTKI